MIADEEESKKKEKEEEKIRLKQASIPEEIPLQKVSNNQHRALERYTQVKTTFNINSSIFLPEFKVNLWLQKGRNKKVFESNKTKTKDK